MALAGVAFATSNTNISDTTQINATLPMTAAAAAAPAREGSGLYDIILSMAKGRTKVRNRYIQRLARGSSAAVHFIAYVSGQK